MGNPRSLSNEELTVKIRERKFPKSENIHRGSVYSRSNNGSIRQSESFLKRKTRDNEIRE